MTKLSTILFTIMLLIPLSTVQAHRSGCHRWHSCPSDTGSYICGDLGYTSECPIVNAVKPKPVPVPLKLPSNIPDKSCLTKAIKIGNSFLSSRGYKENKDGSWTDLKGSYPTSKISKDLDTKQTDAYNKCIKLK